MKQKTGINKNNILKTFFLKKFFFNSFKGLCQLIENNCGKLTENP